MPVPVRTVDVAAFHEGVLYGYSDRPEFWSSLDQTRIERAETQIIRVCREKASRPWSARPIWTTDGATIVCSLWTETAPCGTLWQDPSCGRTLV